MHRGHGADLARVVVDRPLQGGAHLGGVAVAAVGIGIQGPSEQAIQGQPGLLADAREIERSGRSFMVDTLESLHQDLRGKSLCLLLGSDGGPIQLPGGGRYENIMDAARQLVDEDPKRVAQLVKTWMNEEAA